MIHNAEEPLNYSKHSKIGNTLVNYLRVNNKNEQYFYSIY